ncbi:MAG TPA: hypothetical protein VF668_01355 [Pyrinomonadaceae bacterium]|jgi:phospholipid N-methyltransferase
MRRFRKKTTPVKPTPAESLLAWLRFRPQQNAYAGLDAAEVYRRVEREQQAFTLMHERLAAEAADDLTRADQEAASARCRERLAALVLINSGVALEEAVTQVAGDPDRARDALRRHAEAALPPAERTPPRERFTVGAVPSREFAPDAVLHVAYVASITYPKELFDYLEQFKLPASAADLDPADDRFTEPERFAVAVAVEAKREELRRTWALGFWRVEQDGHECHGMIVRIINYARDRRDPVVTVQKPDLTSARVGREALRFATMQEARPHWPAFLGWDEQTDGEAGSLVGKTFHVGQRGARDWRGKIGQCVERDGGRLRLHFLADDTEHVFPLDVLEQAPDIPPVAEMVKRLEKASDYEALNEMRRLWWLDRAERPWLYSSGVWRDLLLAVELGQSAIGYRATLAVAERDAARPEGEGRPALAAAMALTPANPLPEPKRVVAYWKEKVAEVTRQAVIRSRYPFGDKKLTPARRRDWEYLLKSASEDYAWAGTLANLAVMAERGELPPVLYGLTNHLQVRQLMNAAEGSHFPKDKLGQTIKSDEEIAAAAEVIRSLMFAAPELTVEHMLGLKPMPPLSPAEAAARPASAEPASEPAAAPEAEGARAAAAQDVAPGEQARAWVEVIRGVGSPAELERWLESHVDEVSALPEELRNGVVLAAYDARKSELSPAAEEPSSETEDEGEPYTGEEAAAQTDGGGAADLEFPNLNEAADTEPQPPPTEAAAPPEVNGRCGKCGYKLPSHGLRCEFYDTTPPAPPRAGGASEVVTLDELRAYFSDALHDERTTAEAHKIMFGRVVASQDSLLAELGKLKKGVLERMAGTSGRDTKKDRLARYALDEALEDFALGKVRTSGRITSEVLFTPGGMLNLIAEFVGGITDEELTAYRKRVAERRAERREEAAEAAAKNQKALTNPETEEEFETFIWHHGMKALAALAAQKKLTRKRTEHEGIIRREGVRAMDDDQLARWDELQAAKARDRRSKQMVERATVKRIEIGEGNYMEIVPWWHDKRNCQTWLVVLAEREDRTTFEELCIAARKLGGDYQRGWDDRPGGFQFFDEGQAEKFVQLQSRDIFELSRLEKLIANRERVRSNAVAHFGGLADRMEDRATESLTRPRRLNTERRVMLAERAADGAREDLAMAETLRRYAADLQSRLTRHTDRIRWRTHAEAFDEILRRAGGQMSKVEYPWPAVGRHTVAEIAREIGDRDGSKLVTQRVVKLARAAGSDVVVFRGDYAADTLRHFYRRARLHRTTRWTLDRVREALGHFKRLRLMNIDSLPELRAALREHLGRRVEPSGLSRADKVMLDLYPGKFPPDYFPTPRDVVELMLEYADMADGLRVLEPSAGGGHIANVVRELYPNTDFTLCEISGLLCKALEAQGWSPVQGDFLSIDFTEGADVDEDGYDRVIANVPFGCDGVGTDIDHVRHAYTMLNARGRLVSLMSDGVFYRGDSKAEEFRAWLDHVGGESFELPEGAFLNGDRPTSWAARIVVIDKLRAAGNDPGFDHVAAASVTPAGERALIN